MVGAVGSQVYQLEERWREARSLQKFLYLVSPMSWRRQHDHLNGSVPAEGTAAHLAAGSRDSTTGTAASGPSGSLSGGGDRLHSGLTQGTQGTQPSLQSRDHLDRAMSLQDIIDTFLEVGCFNVFKRYFAWFYSRIKQQYCCYNAPFFLRCNFTWCFKE